MILREKVNRKCGITYFSYNATFCSRENRIKKFVSNANDSYEKILFRILYLFSHMESHPWWP